MWLRRFSLSLICIFLLSNCGFKPVHSQKNTDGESNLALAAITLPEPEHRLEQLFLNQLDNAINPTSIQTNKRYYIRTNIVSKTNPIAIQQDRSVTRYSTTVTLYLALFANEPEDKEKPLIASWTLNRKGSYDRVESDYATFTSERNTSHHIVRELAQDAKFRLASALLDK